MGMQEQGIRLDLDLGDDHWLGWLDTGDDPPQHCGAVIGHLKLDGSVCEGSVQWAPTKFAREHPDRLTENERNRPRWTLETVADAKITLSPSLVCHCGDHGFIRNGTWVRA